LHPGQRNSLDALCKRYDIDNSHRQLHGALLDAEILARLYLAMTGGQTSLILSDEPTKHQVEQTENHQAVVQQSVLSSFKVIKANDSELNAHQDYLKLLAKTSGAEPLWNKLN